MIRNHFLPGCLKLFLSVLLALPHLCNAQEVTSFTLVNAGNNADLLVLEEGVILNLSELPNALNIRANTNPPEVGSVVFGFEGNSTYQVESDAPYALGGDNNGNYNNFNLTVGNKSLTATPFTGSGGSGEDGTSLTINFIVANSGGGDPEIPHAPENLAAILGSDYEGEEASQNIPGLIIHEAEFGFQDTPGGWVLHNGNPSYLEAGSNHLGNTNGETIIQIITIADPGVYRLQMKSNITGSNPTESNDTWFKIDNSADVHFFCVEGGALSGTAEFTNILSGGSTDKSIYYPSGNAMNRPDHGNENPGRNGFFKVYRSGNGEFKWSARTIDNNGFPVYAYFANPGVYQISFSERSEGHKLDRFALTHIDLVGTGVPQEILDGPPSNTSADINAQVVLTLDPPSSGESYELQRSTNPFFANAPFEILAFGPNAFGVNDLANNTTHYFRIRTVLDGERSEWSNTAIITLGTPPDDEGIAVISGELKKWHGITLSFEGPFHDEMDTDPNPFLDYRFEVAFTHEESGKVYKVPGYFAADGDAANTGATLGNIWRVHFSPDEVGEWTYQVSFLGGSGIAIEPDMGGIPVVSLDGLGGSFNVTNTDKTGRDFRAKGRLSYVGKHHLQFEETGEYFLKGGADAPENFLAYEDFDNTPDMGNRRKSWSPHAQDYMEGDPTWKNGIGTEIIGALNYLASEEMNAFSFLTMNIQGDDKNVYPYVNNDDFLHFDISKIDQWDIVFAHGQRKGLFLHFKTQETENDQLLDGGQLDIERKLYYRMLVARFGYHLALNWNLGEENDIWQELNDPNNELVKSYASYIKDIDPYHHHIVIHTYPGQQDEVYEPLLGNASDLTGASIQTAWNGVYNATRNWVSQSKASGKPWVVANDEQGSANVGVPPFIGYEDPNGNIYEGQLNNGNDVNVDHNGIRKQTLWGNLMAGGAGVEYYFGYQVPQSDLTCEDYRSRDFMWDYTRYALNFFTENLPFQDMSVNEQSNNARWILNHDEAVYAVYSPEGGITSLEVGEDEYIVKAYNPRTGEFAVESQLVEGPFISVQAPDQLDQDWAFKIERASTLSADTEMHKAELNIYPNPTTDFIQVTNGRAESIQIFTYDGKLVEQITENQPRIEMGHLPSGIYLIKIQSNGGVESTHKVVKQ
jgi:hypothetical protein